MENEGNRWTLREFRTSLPAEKNQADSYWTRWVLRPLSYPFSWAFLRLGWSANSVSYLSALIAALGGALLTLPVFSLRVAGAILLNLFAVLDCADGNLARVTKTTGPWGAWADALGGYVAYGAALLGAGMAAEISSYRLPSYLCAFAEGIWPRGGWVLMGGVAAAANFLMRLSYQTYRNLRGQREESREEISLEKRFSENLGVTGLLMPAILVGVLTGTVGCVVFFYFLFYVGGSVVSILRQINRVEDWRRTAKALDKAGQGHDGE